MKLYHGSNVEIYEIDLTKCRPYKDFGQGFYLTTLPEQAVKMANQYSFHTQKALAYLNKAGVLHE